MQTLDGMPFSSFEDGSPYFVKMRKRVMEVGLQLKRTLFSLFWHRDEVIREQQEGWGNVATRRRMGQGAVALGPCPQKINVSACTTSHSLQPWL